MDIADNPTAETERSGAGLSRPTPKSADTRARIVGGALRALERHGLNETTTRRIAAEADVQLATLHYHFKNKEAVLLAVLDAFVAELAQALGETGGAGRTPDVLIADIMRASWAYVERTRIKQIVQYELTLYALRTRGSAWFAKRQYQAYVDAYATALRDGAAKAARGLSEAHARDLARVMLAGIDGLILQALAGAPDESLAAALDAVTAAARARARLLLRRTRAAPRKVAPE